MLLSILTLSSIAYIAKAEEGSSTNSTEKIKARLEKSFEKTDLRNKAIELKREIKNERANVHASTTAQLKAIRIEEKEVRASSTERMKELRTENRAELKDIRASSTMMFKELKNEKRVALKNMQLHEFEIRKESLVRELNVSLKNLDNIDVRVNNRIASSTANGKDMTNAKIALATAETKLASAKTLVSAFASLSYASSTVTTGTTTKITLERPRKAGDDAIKAVKDARDSFKLVVVAIAHSLGQKIEATSTSSINN